jgi:hypothetical protein
MAIWGRAMSINIKGMRFGSLIPLRAIERERSTLCICYLCQHTVIVATEALLDGSVTSCGCQPRAAFQSAQQERERGRPA